MVDHAMPLAVRLSVGAERVPDGKAERVMAALFEELSQLTDINVEWPNSDVASGARSGAIVQLGGSSYRFSAAAAHWACRRAQGG